MLRAGLARAAAAAARRAAQADKRCVRLGVADLRLCAHSTRRRPFHTPAFEAAAALGWPAALAGGAAAATAWATLDQGDYASGLRRVAVATRHLVPVLVDWKAHEVRRCAASLQRLVPAQAGTRLQPLTRAPRSFAWRYEASTRLRRRRMRPPRTPALQSACATWR